MREHGFTAWKKGGKNEETEDGKRKERNVNRMELICTSSLWKKEREEK